ncbi:hypothetical protein JK167_11495 [Levilactobacillus brevis]|uniref:Uncharacterized protein n=1 Tax=Levilactobacillus brevis TaxID=1580 RepID=A0A1W6NFA1_LEVBR|nr:hypothetical protein [Levilactobacillus brevis]ARN92170.1 hypothetical protein AZI11_04215 [Levilactobacillus brevis]ARN94864.1 hypothetical protein AZI12_04240 [Levilactobacillus brevis]MBS0948306.1 hypothetical protein [Levilactobacillus brevis]MBS1011451.1 hypothetical protein [Levilactobacillus brevis]
MNKAVSELVDTLNGSLKELPAVAHQFVNQWVVSHYVLSVVWLLLVVVVALAIVFIIKSGNNISNSKDTYEDWDDLIGHMIAIGCLMIAAAVFVGCMVWCVYAATSPYITIIETLK